MSKPMYCPMSLMATTKVIEGARGGFTTELAYVPKPVVCTPDCAWAVEIQHERYGCGIILKDVDVSILGINTRPLKDDEDKYDDLSPEVQRIYNDLIYKLKTNKFDDIVDGEDQ